MIHYMKLKPQPFEDISNGRKKIEMRLFDEKRQKIKTGDQIVFTRMTDEETLTVKVKAIHRFANFKQLYKAFDKTVLGYQDNEKADPKDMDNFYSKEEQAKYGVVGIEIELKK